MKKILDTITVSAAALLMAAGCSEIPGYDGDAGIYFAVGNGSTAIGDTVYLESTSIPFVVTDAADTVVKLPVKIMGPVAAHDRRITVAVVAEGTTAQAGDYDPLQDHYMLRAGEIYGHVPIRIYRTPSLKDQQRCLAVKLVPNGDFGVPITAWRTGTDKYVDVSVHKIYFSDKYIQLPGFNTYFFGPFSEKKLLLMCELFNLRVADFNASFGLTKGRAMGQVLQNYLDRREREGDTIYEDYLDQDGNRVKMRAGENIMDW